MVVEFLYYALWNKNNNNNKKHQISCLYFEDKLYLCKNNLQITVSLKKENGVCSRSLWDLQLSQRSDTQEKRSFVWFNFFFSNRKQKLNIKITAKVCAEINFMGECDTHWFECVSKIFQTLNLQSKFFVISKTFFIV